MRNSTQRQVLQPFALATIAAAGLLGGASDARAEVVDPYRTTLARLAAEADAIVTAHLAPGSGHAHVLLVDGVRRLRGDLPAPETASASGCVGHGEAAAGGERPGLAFLVRTPEGGYRLIGGERGWVADDGAAEAFVASLPSGAPGASALVQALGSESARVREDALRDLSQAPMAKLDQASLSLVRASAEGALAEPDPEPAIRVLATLPGGAGEPALLRAARDARTASFAGHALAGRGAAIDRLVTEVADGSLPVATRASIATALGFAGERRATAALAGLLPTNARSAEGAPLAAASLRALRLLGDASAAPAVKALLLGEGASQEARLRAALALAYMGGDEAIGALEFAEANHADPAVRAYITRLRSSPGEARLELE